MKKSNVTGWTAQSPTPAQIEEFFAQVRSGQITKAKLQPFLNGKYYKPDKSWHEEGGVIYFSVTSDGTTGEGWIERLKSKGFRMDESAERILRSEDFKITNGVVTEVAVLKGKLFSDRNRITKNIRAEASKRKLMKPNAEIACLIREKFSDEQLKAMGLWWIMVMHKPVKSVKYSDGNLLAMHCSFGGNWLASGCNSSAYSWSRKDGFAFVAAQMTLNSK